MSSSSTNTLGKYQIIREIARSNDIVYEAIDPSINRRIALKELLIAPNLTPAQKRERIERFHREGRAAGRLSHQNIVTIYEVGQEGDRYFIAMEFLEGQTLRDVIQMRGALPIKEATDISLQILSALGYAHQNGVVHRDIKPENVQILPGGHVKITDFGIARLMGESSITVDGQVFGTPSYMSPEQVAGQPIDQRSDLFSLGVMLYEMLAGRKPFAGDSVVTITYNIMHREPTPLPGIPPYLTAIVRKAMEKEIDQRYSSADEFAEDLRNERTPFGVIMQPDNFSPAGGTTYQGASMPPPPMTGYPPPPSTGMGSPSGQVPDPFGAPPPDPFSRPVQPYTPPPPRPPRQPILSADTRNFVGIFMLVVGLTGMLIFAIWAISVAYNSFEQGVSSKQAKAYFDQGTRLFNEGKYEDSIDQFQNALRVSPKGPVSKAARASLAAAYINIGNRELQAGNIGGAASAADQAAAFAPDSAAAHLFAGTIYSRRGDPQKAVEEWQIAIKLGEASGEAKTAREYLGQYYNRQAEAYVASGQMGEAMKVWQKTVQECTGSDAAIYAQQRLDQSMGIGQ